MKLIQSKKKHPNSGAFPCFAVLGVQLIEVDPLLMKPGAATISANFVQLTAPAVRFVSLHYVRHAD
ncbi:MAG: hypothetical protein ACI4MM_11525 [Candidatus Ventricola sp.]